MKYGFVYIWYDKKKKRYYIGSHWGTEDDGYICSSQWMQRSRLKRPQDFKRRILTLVYTNREDLYLEEQKWLDRISDHEIAKFNTTTKKRETVKYYNLCKSVKKPWYMYEENIKTVGQKISASKKGKNTGPRDPSVGEAISKAKKGKPLTKEHKQALTGIKKPSHTDEWKEENSKRMKKQWSDGSRKRKEPKKTLTSEEQAQLSSQNLKSKWADPIWAANQRAKLKASWDKRKNK